MSTRTTPLTPQDWHTRFMQQARWTRDLRAYLYPRAGLGNARRVLDVGCGTGAIPGELAEQVPLLHGLDIDRAHLRLAMGNAPGAILTLGDAHNLPYPDDIFDITLCHFALLWMNDPARVLREMARVTCPGGAVLALAEPDYGGRVDYPLELVQLGEWQTESLRRQGADPLMGRRLAGLFHGAGLQNVETGALGGQWIGTPDWEAWESEWAVLESDLDETCQVSGHPFQSESLKKTWQLLKALDKSAWQSGQRVLFVPTFYAWGRVSRR
ncbi:MAG: methyltransferase domain-containing protein [Chloroflexi bacterium]|nr:methyltransferase domain-containing protein [Chloroflexota bacterium]